MRRARLAFFAFLLILSYAFGDVVKLKNGKSLEGRLIHEDEAGVRLKLYSGDEQEISRKDIESIQRKRSKFDDYDDRLKQSPDTAEGHFRLSTWCKSQGLARLAEDELQKSISKDPHYEPARKSLGQKKLGDRWVGDEEWNIAHGYVKKNGRWVSPAERLQGLTEIKLTIGVEVDMTREQLQALADRFKEAAAKLWESTEGNLYISSATLKDKSKEGNVHVENLDKVNTNKGPYGYASPAGVWLGGKFPVITFCHEMGHYLFSLPEEYDEPKCSECVMEPWAGKFQFCDASNHKAGRKDRDCWSAILRKYPRWKHPNKDFGPAPELKVSIIDQ